MKMGLINPPPPPPSRLKRVEANRLFCRSLSRSVFTLHIRTGIRAKRIMLVLL